MNNLGSSSSSTQRKAMIAIYARPKKLRPKAKPTTIANPAIRIPALRTGVTRKVVFAGVLVIAGKRGEVIDARFVGAIG